MSDKAEIWKGIGADIWAGLKREDIGAVAVPLVLFFLCGPGVGIAFAMFFLACSLLDAAFYRTASATAQTEWGAVLKKWGEANTLADGLLEDRIADMYFHICLFTNFLQAPHAVPEWIAEAQRIYAEKHMVN